MTRTCWRCEAARPASAKTVELESESKSELTFRDLMLPHLGQTVHVNFDNPSRLEEAQLVAVHAYSFAVSNGGFVGRRHFPFQYILSIVEAEDQTSPCGKTLQIEVYRQVFAKGMVGVGFSTPI